MAHRTTFAGLAAPDPGESTQVLNGDFIYRNPDLTDQLLRIGAVTHRHDGHPGLPNPVTPVTLAAVPAGGSLDAGTYYATYTAVDQQGGETMAAPAQAITLIAGVQEPLTGPSAAVSSAGGIMPDGNYAYAYTFTDGAGGETTLGPITWVYIDPGFASAQVQLSGLTPVGGAVQWRLWRSYEGEDWHLVTQGSGDTYLDTGFNPPDDPARPPDANTTSGTSLISLTLPGSAEAAFASAVTINVYLSLDPSMPAPSLYATLPVACAATTISITDDIVMDGSPPGRNLSIPGAARIFGPTEVIGWQTLVASASGIASGGSALAGSAHAQGELLFTGAGGTVVTLKDLGGGSALVTINGGSAGTGGGGPSSPTTFVASAGNASGVVNGFLGFAASGGATVELVQDISGSAVIMISASGVPGPPGPAGPSGGGGGGLTLGVGGSAASPLVTPVEYIEFAPSGGTQVGVTDLGGGSARVIISLAEGPEYVVRASGGDDYAPIQDAINKAQARAGRVRLPDPLYKTSQGLVATAYCNIFGAGMDSTKIQAASAIAGPVLDMQWSSGNKHYLVQDISLDANGLASTGLRQYVATETSVAMYFVRVRAGNATGYQFVNQGCEDSTWIDCLVDGDESNAGALGKAVQINIPTGAHTLLGCTFFGACDLSYQLIEATGCTIGPLVLENSSNLSSTVLSLDGCYLYDGTTGSYACIDTPNNLTNIIAKGCYFVAQVKRYWINGNIGPGVSVQLENCTYIWGPRTAGTNTIVQCSGTGHLYIQGYGFDIGSATPNLITRVSGNVALTVLDSTGQLITPRVNSPKIFEASGGASSAWVGGYLGFAASGGAVLTVQDMGSGSAVVLISASGSQGPAGPAGSQGPAGPAGGGGVGVGMTATPVTNPATYLEFQGSGGTGVSVSDLGGGSALVTVSASGGAATVDSRMILDDECITVGLPSGVVASAGVTFDSNYLARYISSAGVYLSPSGPLYGPLVAEFDVEFVNAYTNGNVGFGIVRLDTNDSAKIKHQSDGNWVFYAFGGSTPFATGGSKGVTGMRMRIQMSISDLMDSSGTEYNGATAQQIALSMREGMVDSGASQVLTNSNAGTVNLEAISGKIPIGGTTTPPGIPSGTQIAVQIVTDGTRVVRLYGIRFRRGFLPL